MSAPAINAAATEVDATEPTSDEFVSFLIMTLLIMKSLRAFFDCSLRGLEVVRAMACRRPAAFATGIDV